MRMTESTCKGCGKPIVWGITEDDKKIPLDPKAPVYEEDGPIVRRTIRAMVSHFATCSQANKFSSIQKRDPVLLRDLP